MTEKTIQLSEELGIPCALTCDAHYLRHEDQEAHEILLCVQTGSFLTDEKRMSLKAFELHVTDPKRLLSDGARIIPTLSRTLKQLLNDAAWKSNLARSLFRNFLCRKEPQKRVISTNLFIVALSTAMLHDKSSEGSIAELKKRLPAAILERAEYELGVIDWYGFNGYFLIVQDFINWERPGYRLWSWPWKWGRFNCGLLSENYRTRPIII